jgi:hypothetical protein
MSWLSKFLNKIANVPEIKIPFGEAMVLRQIADNLDFMSTSDLEMLRDLTLVAIANRKVKKVSE